MKEISDEDQIIDLVQDHPKPLKEASGFKKLKAHKEWKVLYPNEENVLKCLSCRNFLRVNESENHICYDTSIVVEGIDFKQCSSDSFQCTKCKKFMPQSVLNFHSNEHKPGRTRSKGKESRVQMVNEEPVGSIEEEEIVISLNTPEARIIGQKLLKQYGGKIPMKRRRIIYYK